jgi:hypothetical protein
MYNDTRRSIFNNGTVQIENEIPDQKIIDYIAVVKQEIVPLQDKAKEIKPEGLPPIKDNNQNNCG